MFYFTILRIILGVALTGPCMVLYSDDAYS